MGQAETFFHDNEHGRENQMLTQDLWTEIRVMRKMGKSIKKISRELMISYFWQGIPLPPGKSIT